MRAQSYSHDAFISYSRRNQDCVQTRLLPQLEECGFKILIDYRDFEIGVPILTNIERAIDGSRHTLVVLSPDWLESEWGDLESLLAGTQDPTGRRRKILPVMFESCQPPPRLAMLVHADFTRRETWDAEFSRLRRELDRDSVLRDSALRHRNLTLEQLTRESLAPDPFTRFDEWLDEVERDIGDNTALLALDEFEALDNMLSKHRFDADGVFATLRHMIQHRRRFKVLLAGAHAAEELAYSARYLITVQMIKLGYLEEEETRQLVERPVKDFALEYDPDATRRVIEITRGHPFLVQQLCAEIVTLKNEQRPEMRRGATTQDVEAAVPEALQAGALFFADIENNQLPRNGIEVLRDLAGRGERAIVPEDQLSREYQGELGAALSALLRRDVIERVEGGYRVQVELIRRWFARQQAMWQ